MKIVSLPYRTAVFNALQNVVYKTKKIPVFEEYFTVDTARPIAKIDNYQSYIILLNQTVNKDSIAKCVHNDQASIQIQVITKYPTGTGGSAESERIMQLVMDRLFPTSNDIKSSLVMLGFGLWKAEIVTYRNLQYEDDDFRVWNTVLTLLSHVSQ